MNKRGVSRTILVAAIIIILLVAGGASYYIYMLNQKPSLGKTSIKIGLITWLTGSSAIYGWTMSTAAKFAVKQFNDAGGILGTPVELIIEDDAGLPDQGVTAARKLILQDNVDFLTGIGSSTVALAVAPIAAQYKKIYITGGASSPDLTKMVIDNYDKNKYIFRAAPNTTQCAWQMVPAAMDLWHPKTFAFVGTDYKPCYDWSSDCLTEFTKYGVTRTGEYMVSASSMDWSPEITKIVDGHPDLVLNFIIAGHYSSFITQWYTLKPSIIHFALDAAWNSLREIVLTMPAAGDYSTAFTWMYRAATTPKTIPFYDAYLNYSGKGIYGWSDVFTYDSYYMLKEAIERAGTIETEAVLKELEKTDYIGACGRYVFERGHQIRTGEGYIQGTVIQWYNKKVDVIWPLDIATASYRPYWS